MYFHEITLCFQHFKKKVGKCAFVCQIEFDMARWSSWSKLYNTTLSGVLGDDEGPGTSRIQDGRGLMTFIWEWPSLCNIITWN